MWQSSTIQIYSWGCYGFYPWRIHQKSPIYVSQWAQVDALLTWILIYSYNINWLIASTPYPGRLGLADGLCNRRVRTRVRAHWLVDGFVSSLVCQYQLVSLTILWCQSVLFWLPKEVHIFNVWYYLKFIILFDKPMRPEICCYRVGFISFIPVLIYNLKLICSHYFC